MAKPLPSLSDLPSGLAAKTSRGGLPSLSDLPSGLASSLPSTDDVLAGRGFKSPAKKKEKGGGGFFGTLGRFPGDLFDSVKRSPGQLQDLGAGIPSGVIAGVMAGVHDVKKGNVPIPWDAQSWIKFFDTSEVAGQWKEQGKGIAETGANPLRNLPLTAATILLPFLGGGSKVLLTAKGVKAGRITPGEIPSALVSPPPRVHRELRSGDLTVNPLGSKSALGQVIQGATDSLLQGMADAKPSGLAGRAIDRRVNKVVNARSRAAERAAKAQGAALIAAGKRLSDTEQKALQLVAEQAPLSERILTTEARLFNATSAAERAAHQAELDLLNGARAHLVDRNALIPESGARGTLLADTKANLGKYLFHGTPSDDAAISIERHGFDSGTMAGHWEDTLEYARGGNILVFKRPPHLVGPNVRDADIIKWIKDTKPKPVEVFRADSYSHEIPYGHRSQELGDNPEPPSVEGRPEFAPGQEKLKAVYDQMAKAAGDRERLLIAIGALSQESAQGRKTNAGRVSIGAEYVDPTASRLGLETPALKKARADVARYERLANISTDPKKLAKYTTALTVAQERLAGLESAATKRITDTGIVGADYFTAGPDAVRIPDVLKKPPRNLGVIPRRGASGLISELKAPKSLSETYRGVLRENATRRQDTTRLVGESSIEASTYAAMIEIHEFVKHASREFRNKRDIAVRLDDIGKIPEELREFLGDPDEYFGRVTPRQSASKLEELRSQLFINREQLSSTKRAELDQLERDGKIGWVSRDLLGELAKPRGGTPRLTKTTATWDTINNASRMAILYLKPAYAVPNMLGNAALNLIQQGWAAPSNIARAVRITNTDKQLAAMLRVNMGEGLSTTMGAQGGLLARSTNKLAEGWSRLVDEPFRIASFVHEAKLAGYKTNAELKDLMTNPAKRDDLYDVSTVANREVIDFGNLTHVERDIIRRFVFFYPWGKGSTIYAGRMVREHPLKTAFQAQLGALGAQYSDEELGSRPSFMKGAFPLGTGRTGLGSAAALLETATTVPSIVAGLLTGDYAGATSKAANFAVPALSAATSVALGIDPQTGRPYKGGTSLAEIAKDQLIDDLPQVAFVRNIVQAMKGEGKNRLYPPNVQDEILKILLSSLVGHKTNYPVMHRMGKMEERKLNPRER